MEEADVLFSTTLQRQIAVKKIYPDLSTQPPSKLITDKDCGSLCPTGRASEPKESTTKNGARTLPHHVKLPRYVNWAGYLAPRRDLRRILHHGN